ncbi:MAG: Phosphoenolpyruvate synthase (EC [uncultured Aureispira sp.]|uniref:Phosphoenolpyruvate synthase n=1 Tax=uncultured Aureispira sp. TaxID=1331704 RepID=A0A6S6RY49_9BACT|nr:MAG: Phosphoenolpyruvate synthase (EC [uncultured Aureispira sp.]
MYKALFIPIFFIFISLQANLILGQQVPILNHTISSDGRVQIEVNSSPGNYYILKVRHNLNLGFDLASSMTLGQAGTTVLTESLESYPITHYQVLEYPIASPYDTDGDGVDDVTEYQNFPAQNPLNAANSVQFTDGAIAIDSFTTFNQLSIARDLVQWSEFLNGKRFAKFIITDFDTSPKIYFINGNTHGLHADFTSAIGISQVGNSVKKGQIIYHPTTPSNNGALGTFAFNYSNGHGESFEVVQKSHELLAANMPFLTNNLSYFVTTNSQDEYEQDSILYETARVPLLFEAEVYAQVDYWGLNETEGYGFFRAMTLSEIPGLKDIVLYASIPNALPRVGGIITSVIQTPLSHVNLRAIQDNVPNAFIRDPLSVDSIANLLNHNIYFKVEQDKFFIREASSQEVNDWYEHLRPDDRQTCPLNLEHDKILPLDEITFSMFDGFGAKCANVATMRTFGFPEGTIPDGFGIPFYYYQKFMKDNLLFEQARLMLRNPDFQKDRNLRAHLLEDFRKKIEQALMPNWMQNELANLQAAFPNNSTIRCRSSTNNEDLPGFNGAGLYASKTHHPVEGHLAKTVKEIYASLWNLRAFDEREFYKVNHFTASMAILCHNNYSGELANGVGVSKDPIYKTNNTFYYFNSQVGEELITNPDGTAVPEELLLDANSTSSDDYILVRRSNLAPNNTTILEGNYLNQIRAYLKVIHQEFEIRYNAVGNESFAMEIEYKITREGQLIIKQARPWVAYVSTDDVKLLDSDQLNCTLFPNPASDYINVDWIEGNPSEVWICNTTGRQVLHQSLSISKNPDFRIQVKDLPAGMYILTGYLEHNGRLISKKFVKR